MNRHTRTARAFSFLRVAVAILGCSTWWHGQLEAATITVLNMDGAGEGFNDPTPVSPVGGNPGTTVGQQRLNAFNEATRYWADRLQSSVTIVVEATMDPLACSTNSGILGGAATLNVFRDFSSFPFTGTWYHGALADRLESANLSGANDIGAVFNSDVDDDPGCLTGLVWYYGFDAAPAGTFDFIETVKHEIAHGLGVSPFVTLSTGEKFLGFNDIYMTFLEDHSASLLWRNMSNAQRAASAVDTGDLHWVGPNALAASGILSAGTVGSHVQMYAPNPLELGSSVGHWDTVLKDIGTNLDELMEPFDTGSPAVLLTDELLQDLGWNSFGGTSCAQDPTPLNLSDQTVSGTQLFQACTSITTGGTFFVVPAGASATFLAGRGPIAVGNGFTCAGTCIFDVDGPAFE